MIMFVTIPLSKSIFRQSQVKDKKYALILLKTKKKKTRICLPSILVRPLCGLIPFTHCTFNFYHSGQNGDEIMTPVEISELQESAKK